MSELRDFRSSFIPSGKCIEEPTAQAFRRIDSISPDDVTLHLARTACEHCPQLNYCRTQAATIAHELGRWGAQLGVIGRDLYIIPEAANLNTPHESYLQFDLSELPTDPIKQLNLLRQGVRTKQLKLNTRTPAGVIIIANRYMQRIAHYDMDLYKEMEVRLTAEESYHALCNIILILCQQADFKNFTAAKTVRRGGLEHPRYLPDKFNYETNDPTIQHYLYDVIKLRQLGFQRAGYVAAYHSPEFCSEMIDHFLDFENMNRSLITQVMGNNLANPLPALERFMRRLTEVTEAFPAARHTNRTRWAMGSKGLDELKDPPIRKKKIYEIINDSRLT